MSKKLLALLVAVSTCCAFGCSDDDSDSCKTGEKRCDGNNAQICVNGNWSKGTPCANGCDKATGVCKDDNKPEACTTAGEKRCSGKQLQECKDGNWSKVEVCTGSCDEAKKECVEPIEPPTGNECAPGVTNKDCTPACSADKATGYFWNSKTDAIGSKTCPKKDCYIDGTSVKCQTKGETCDKNSTKKTCVDANTVSFCNNNGEMQTKTCNSCTLNADSTYYCCDGDNSKCQSTDKKCEEGGTEYCLKHCLDDGSKGYYYSKGAVVVVDCSEKRDCTINSQNRVVCKSKDNAGGGSGTGDTGNLEDCTATSSAKCKVACNDDKSVGYYWNGNKSEVGKRECPNKDCIIEGTSVKCAGASTCDQKPVCNEAGNKVTYCSSSSGLTDKDCPQCYVDDDTFWCNGDQNLPQCAKGATSKCIGTCLSDTEGVFWDNNTNAVKDKTCTAPKKCNATKSGYVSCK